jgi:hypothetical protein
MFLAAQYPARALSFQRFAGAVAAPAEDSGPLRFRETFNV